MHWPSLLAAALAALFVLAPSGAHACSCVQTSPEVALAEHDAVFEGRVLEVEPASSPAGRLRATLEVVQHWKGVETERVVVTTAAMESTCGVAFEVGTSWLIYADLEEGELRTGLCSRTRRIEDAAEDVASLGAGVVPVEITEDDEVEAEPEDERPARGGCASCAIGARDPDDRSRAWMLAPVVALATARRARRRRA